tara:strand:- start:115 stop:699 length:585 start_codon:yes stop_codon:yes gene_type:complete
MANGFSQKSVDLAQSADSIHIDVMDGKFVENRIISAEEVAKLKSNIPKEVHLMVLEPENYIEDFAKAGVERISFHIETAYNPEKVISLMEFHELETGIAISPETDVDDILKYLDSVDFVVVMSVHPGKSGQVFIEKSLEKIRLIRSSFPLIDIEVDGGINVKTAKLAIEAGANILVSGSFIYSGNPDENIGELR